MPLLERGIDVDKGKNDGWTPLYIAASVGDAGCVKHLILAGCDPNKPTFSGRRPILVASEKGRTACVRLLLDAAADVEQASYRGSSPLERARREGHDDVITLLSLERAADRLLTPAPPGTPAAWAVNLFSQPMSEFDGALFATALRRAEALGAPRDQVLELRLQGARLLKQQKLSHLLAVQLIALATDGDDVAMTTLLNSSLLANSHSTADAIRPPVNAQHGVVGVLDVDAALNDGKTALFLSAAAGHVACLRLLLAAGADTEKAAPPLQATPLFAACQSGQADCVRLLLAAASNPCVVDTTDTAATFVCCQRGHAECLGLLLSAGADGARSWRLDSKERRVLQDPLQQALSRGHHSCVALLRSPPPITLGLATRPRPPQYERDGAAMAIAEEGPAAEAEAEPGALAEACDGGASDLAHHCLPPPWSTPLAFDSELWSYGLQRASALGASAHELEWLRTRAADAEQVQLLARNGVGCPVTFVRASKLLEAVDSPDGSQPALVGLPSLHELRRRRPDWLAVRTIRLDEICYGAYSTRYLAVCARHETASAPDPTGAQLRALVAYLRQHPAAEYIFYAHSSLPLPPSKSRQNSASLSPAAAAAAASASASASATSPAASTTMSTSISPGSAPTAGSVVAPQLVYSTAERLEHEMSVPHVARLYLGCAVLLLLDGKDFGK